MITFAPNYFLLSSREATSGQTLTTKTKVATGSTHSQDGLQDREEDLHYNKDKAITAAIVAEKTQTTANAIAVASVHNNTVSIIDNSLKLDDRSMTCSTNFMLN